MKKAIVMAAVAVLVLVGSAFAQDLVGKWVVSDKSWGARDGETEHEGFDHKGEGWTQCDKMTLIVERQKDRALRGQWCGPGECEDLVGVIKSSGQIRMVDEDGYFKAEMVGDKMEVCYMEADDDFRIATCKMMEKE